MCRMTGLQQQGTPFGVKGVRADLMHVHAELRSLCVLYNAAMACFPHPIRGRDKAAAYFNANKDNVLRCCVWTSSRVRGKVYAESVGLMRLSWECPAIMHTQNAEQ